MLQIKTRRIFKTNPSDKSMNKQRQFPFAIHSLKRRIFRLHSLIMTGLLFLSLAFSACSTIRLQTNQLTETKKIVLPRNMEAAEEDYNITKETACVITVNDDSGDFFMGKDKIAKGQLTERVAGKLRDQTPDKKIAYIESAETVKYGTIVELLNLIRKSDTDKIGFVVIRKDKEKVGGKPTMLAVKLPAEPDLSAPLPTVKPNPLTLVVEIDKTNQLLLNKEPTGDISDTSVLIDRLTMIFKDREKNGYFREGTNEIEKTIFVKAPRGGVMYGDVIKVINAVKMAGAQPIGLQIDDLAN